MDKNTITGFILIAAILIVFSWWNQPSEEQVAELRKQDSIAAVENKRPNRPVRQKPKLRKPRRQTSWLKLHRTLLHYSIKPFREAHRTLC